MSQSDNTKTFSLHLTNLNELQQAFMPFVAQGGVFIATLEDYNLGDKVELKLQLLQEPEPYHIDGKVIWITPPNAQDNRQAGIGVQFDTASSERLLPRILQYLKETQ
jgi:type IV pilus assembly protein PilZ